MLVFVVYRILVKRQLKVQRIESSVVSSFARFIITYFYDCIANSSRIITRMLKQICIIHSLINKAEINCVYSLILIRVSQARHQAIPIQINIHQRPLVRTAGFQLCNFRTGLHQINPNVIKIHITTIRRG
ncbi:unknown [Prevotella sp. CAG:617]|nr:unknown [Prevotella sp. CAG:617]